MKNLKFHLLLFLFLSLNIGCLRSDDNLSNEELPDAHNVDDRKVFACRLNGENWEPSYGIFSNNYGYTYHEPTGGLVLGADRKDSSIDRWEQIAIFIKATDIGVYKNLQDYPYLDTEFCGTNSEYYLDTLSSNVVNIEVLDKEEGIIIGTFEFSAINTACDTDTIRITDGRFKVTYK